MSNSEKLLLKNSTCHASFDHNLRNYQWEGLKFAKNIVWSNIVVPLSAIGPCRQLLKLHFITHFFEKLLDYNHYINYLTTWNQMCQYVDRTFKYLFYDLKVIIIVIAVSQSIQNQNGTPCTLYRRVTYLWHKPQVDLNFKQSALQNSCK